MAVIGDYGSRLAIVARQHALNRAAPVRLEGDPLANPELEHVRVGADVLQQTKALDDPMVEVDQFGFRQLVNVDHHEASPSALNGVSTFDLPPEKWTAGLCEFQICLLWPENLKSPIVGTTIWGSGCAPPADLTASPPGSPDLRWAPRGSRKSIS